MNADMVRACFGAANGHCPDCIGVRDLEHGSFDMMWRDTMARSCDLNRIARQVPEPRDPSNLLSIP